jgi:hypothetical protein
MSFFNHSVVPGFTIKPSLVRVYRNLNNGLISILDKKTNLVVGYCDAVQVVPIDSDSDVKCVVLQGGRNRVIRDKQKNVHAYLEGAISQFTNFRPLKDRTFTSRPVVILGDAPTSISYNPYKNDCFYLTANPKKPVQTLAHVIVKCDGTMTAKLK